MDRAQYIREWKRGNEQYARKQRSYLADWKSKNRDRSRSYCAVYRAVQSGALVRPDDCDRCGSPRKPIAYLEDLDDLLSLRWLCRSCHHKVSSSR